MDAESIQGPDGLLAAPFTTSADVYDIIYGDLPYEEQAARIADLVRSRSPGATTLLEVGCGTGAFLREFERHFAVEGLDISDSMLTEARRQLPDAALHLGDMRTFDLGRRFDAIVCLFSSIGYMTTRSELVAAISNFMRHLSPGGVIVIDPWFTPEAWMAGHVGTTMAERNGVVVARFSYGTVDRGVSVADMHHLVGRPGRGVDYFVERHRMGLFTNDEFMGVFAETGLQALRLDDLAFMGRNRYLAFAT